jgi:hypothetical protein
MRVTRQAIEWEPIEKSGGGIHSKTMIGSAQIFHGNYVKKLNWEWTHDASHPVEPHRLAERYSSSARNID